MSYKNSQAPLRYDLWKVLPLNAVGWILVLILVPIFMVYRSFIDLILRLKIGKKYGGLFNREDGFFITPDYQSKYCITTVFYIRSDKKLDLFHKIRDIFQKKVFDNPEQYPKLTGSKREFGGYPYWIKNDCLVDDVVHPLKVPENVELNEEYLKKCTAEVIGAEYGKNGTVLWDVHVGENPLKEDYADNCYRYPVILRFQHGIGDGMSLVALYVRLFGDEKSKNYGGTLFNKKKTHKSSMELIKQYLFNSLKTLYLYLNIAFVTFGRTTLSNQLRPNDVNALHASKYSGEKIAAWDVVDLSLMKNIKKRTNTKFSNVVYAAVSASMTNFFKRTGEPVPDFTSGMITLMLDFPSMDESKPVKLINKTTATFVDLPCIHKFKTLVGSLENVEQSINQQMKHSDAVGNRMTIANIAGFFPLKVVSMIMGMTAHTFLVTNVPGASQFNVLDGCILEKNIAFAPNGRGIGLSFTFLTHNDLFEVSILVDKTLTESQEEVQRMVDDLIRYIKMLDIESRELYEDI